jgi:hypothetical protein
VVGSVAGTGPEMAERQMLRLAGVQRGVDEM